MVETRKRSAANDKGQEKIKSKRVAGRSNRAAPVSSAASHLSIALRNASRSSPDEEERIVLSRRLNVQQVAELELAAPPAPDQAAVQVPDQAVVQVPGEANAPEAAIEIPTRRSARINLGPPVFDIYCNSDLGSIIITKVLLNFSPLEQIRFGGTSRLWQYNLAHVSQQLRSLVLHLSAFTRNVSRLKTYFHANVGNNFAPLTMAKKAEFILNRNQWNRPSIDLLGELYYNIEHLTIYQELVPNIELLAHLLGKFEKVTTLSLILSQSVRERDFLQRLFTIIGGDFGAVSTLHLYFYADLRANRNQPVQPPFPALNNLENSQALAGLKNFSLHCSVENFSQIIGNMCVLAPHWWPIQSLSLRAEMPVNQISAMFVQNPRLIQIKRLQLTNITNLTVVVGYLKNFTNLESLQLWWSGDNMQDLDLNWYTAISELKHLRELELYRFTLVDIPRQSLAAITRAKVCHLKVTQRGLFGNIYGNFASHHRTRIIGNEVESGNPLIDNLALQFPSLELFTICSNSNLNHRIERRDIITRYFQRSFLRLRDVNFEFNVAPNDRWTLR